MAAGMGSRYRGLKQMEPLGSGGAVLLDYSVYDAIRSGFGKVVFVIREDWGEAFQEAVGRRWEPKVPVRYVVQEPEMLPEGFTVPPGRQKPWGTGHAVWVARAALREPFAVVNADDFYGRDSFRILARHLSGLEDPCKPDFSMVGFELEKTLSVHGTVSRGVCRTASGWLEAVVERLEVGREGGRIFYREAGRQRSLEGTETVSMNMWGFTPALFEPLGEGLRRFLEEGSEGDSEYLIPRVVDQLVRGQRCRVKVLSTRSSWFGLTYPQDREEARRALAKRVARGAYPEHLWA
jgi:NDP-sugar pyrophosphorylase family protein